MAATIRLIVGLGNPGPQYEGTRHNIGFDVARSVAERVGAKFRQKASVHLAEGAWRGRKLAVAMPQTFMNRSGTAVEELLRKLRIDPRDMLVLVDDIHLPLGKIRLRERGGTGGHNGLEDISDWLDSDDWPRLRIGVGNEFEQGRQADYVLSPFDPSELETVGSVLNNARDAALTFVTDGVLTAMNRYNS